MQPDESVKAPRLLSEKDRARKSEGVKALTCFHVAPASSLLEMQPPKPAATISFALIYNAAERGDVPHGFEVAQLSPPSDETRAITFAPTITTRLSSNADTTIRCSVRREFCVVQLRPPSIVFNLRP